MGEVAEMMDVSPSLLRFWEKRFDIIAPHKNKKGNRLFSADDVRNLKTIYHLTKERGMTLAGAEKYLKANRIAIERDARLAEQLHSIRALLVEIREEMGQPVVADEQMDYRPVSAGIIADEETQTEPALSEKESTPGFIEQTLF